VRARQRRARLQSGFSPLHRRRRLRFQGAMRAPAQHLWRALNWGKRSGRGRSKCIRTAGALLIGPLRGQLAAAPHRARLQRRRDSRARIKRETARNPKRGHAKIGCLLHAQNMTPAPPPRWGGPSAPPPGCWKRLRKPLGEVARGKGRNGPTNRVVAAQQENFGNRASLFAGSPWGNRVSGPGRRARKPLSEGVLQEGGPPRGRNP
jgi:hypothetical protein